MLAASRETGVVWAEEDGLPGSVVLAAKVCRTEPTINRTLAICGVGKNFEKTLKACAVVYPLEWMAVRGLQIFGLSWHT